MTTWIIIAIIGVLLVLFARTMSKNRAWDKVALHSREIMRHTVTLLLLVGTTAGTVFTFSNGKLVLSGIWEQLTSVGGIALALECGVVLSGWYIGEVDHRLMTAKGKDSEVLRNQRTDVMRWFWIIILFSFVANVIFRAQQTHSLLLAVFVSAAPIALVRLFTIVLRPLPVDYEENARQHGQRALAISTQNAGVIINRLQAKMASGRPLSDDEKQDYGASLATIGMWQSAKNQEALHTIARYHGVTVRSDSVIDAEAIVYWDTGEIAAKYNRSERWAQLKIKDIPGARRGMNGRQEAPSSSVRRILGDPDAIKALPAPRVRPKKNEITPNASEETPQESELTENITA